MNLFSKLLRREPAPATRAPAVPAGRRIYAIGDIHGRRDLLDSLIEQIDADDHARGPANTQLIFLGDLIDRGPESAQVVERVLDLQKKRPDTRILLGNHEEVFLKALAGDLAALKFFIRIGGEPTLLSYGIDRAEYASADFPELLELTLARVPPSHIDFLRALEDLVVVGDYAFVHAGVRPSTTLAEQKSKDLRWIREEFLSYSGPYEKVVVHGHSISDDVEFRPNRVGVDTGAYASGRLSAVGFEDARRWVLQT